MALEAGVSRAEGATMSMDAVAWAAQGDSLGAGEILLTSMDTDGVQEGFDCALTQAVSRATRILITPAAAAEYRALRRVLTEGRADAALALDFHYGTYTVNQLKEGARQARHPAGDGMIVLHRSDGWQGGAARTGPREGAGGRQPEEMLRKFAGFPEIR